MFLLIADKMSITSESKLSTCNVSVGADPNKPPCKKAKVLRLEKKQQKMLQRGMNLETLAAKNTTKSLDDFLNEISENSKHKLKVLTH